MCANLSTTSSLNQLSHTRVSESVQIYPLPAVSTRVSEYVQIYPLPAVSTNYVIHVSVNLCKSIHYQQSQLTKSYTCQ